MSTLNEIAANHARKMAMAKAEESTGLSERHLQVVGSVEIRTSDEKPHVPLHFIAVAQDNHIAQAAGY
ncbi:hypothetical protein B7L09_29005 [Pseudomonas mandelii]|uniref:hypothetical protein n=1 Tax=Pseudomonas TaxID=286 RepID=UPI000B979279|nr:MULTISPECIES: hypothetical protein [Pseudomonas]OYP99360.1 hypothetical protein B7L09_29005 [Pseudomonas mandelii]